MVFEIIEKGIHGVAIGGEQISISKTCISLGNVIGEESLKKGFVKIFLDRELNRVGFESTTDNIKGFKILKQEGKSLARITSKLACKYLSRGCFDAKKEDNLWVIEVPEIAGKNE